MMLVESETGYAITEMCGQGRHQEAGKLYARRIGIVLGENAFEPVGVEVLEGKLTEERRTAPPSHREASVEPKQFVGIEVR